MAKVTVSIAAGGCPSAGRNTPVMLTSRGTDVPGSCADWAKMTSGEKSTTTMNVSSADTYRIGTLLRDCSFPREHHVVHEPDYPGAQLLEKDAKPMRT